MPNNTVLQELLKLEEEIVFSQFTNEMAVEIGLKLYETARQRGKAITIDITRNGHRLFHLAMEGTAADNEQWIRRKNNVVNRFGHSSYYISNMLQASGSTFEQVFEVSGADYAAHGGAFPIIIRNVGIVGTVTVSGLPQKEDHDLAVEVLRTFI